MKSRFKVGENMKIRTKSVGILPCMIFSGFFTFVVQNVQAAATQNITLQATQHSKAKTSKKTQVQSHLTETARAEAQLYNELTGKDYGRMGEMDLYSEILTSYQSQNEPEFSAMLNVFLQKHSQSIYADNALYLAGKMALEKKQYGKAVHYFQRVQDQFPRSNKVVSAAFGKGIAYKKMNLERLALKMFEEVKRKYPGSPESFRAGNEVKLIRAN